MNKYSNRGHPKSLLLFDVVPPLQGISDKCQNSKHFFDSVSRISINKYALNIVVLPTGGRIRKTGNRARVALCLILLRNVGIWESLALPYVLSGF